MWLTWSLLTLGMFTYKLSGVGEPFHFLLDSSQEQITEKISIERASLILLFNTSYLEVKEAIIGSKTIYDRFINLKLHENADQKREFFQALEAARKNFLYANEGLEALYSFIKSTTNLAPASKCKLYVPLFPKENLNYYSFVKQKSNRINPGWINLDGEQRLVVDIFVVAFNNLAEKWAMSIDYGNNLVQQLLSLEFPLELYPEIESLTCIDTSNFERITIRKTLLGQEGLLSELSIVTPTQTAQITHLLMVPYHGYVLEQPSSQSMYVRKQDSLVLWEYSCQNLQGLNDKAPLCSIDQIDTACSQALLRGEIENCLENCKFTEDKLEIHSQRLLNEGVYIGTTHFAIADGSKVVYSPPPIIIFTNNLLTLTDKEGEEIKYTADILFDEQKVIVSTLSTEQKEKVRTKGYNNDFWANIPWRDYLVYTASGITVVMVPLTLIGWVMSLSLIHI